MKNTSKLILGTLICVTSPALMAQDWKYGIGTGPAALEVEGDMGFNTTNFGPVEFDIDLDAGDTSDLLESAAGLGGYATNGTWTISGSFGSLTLEGAAVDGTRKLLTEFEITSGELMVGYNLGRTESLSVDVFGGVRYLEHDITSKITNTPTTGTPTQIKRDLANDWTDGVIGLNFAVPLSDQLSWTTRLDAGFGGSEGTYSANTGLAWQFHEHWSVNLYAKIQQLEFEEGDKGDSDWYLYDMDETAFGFTVLYNW